MSNIIIKSGTTSIAGAVVKGSFSYFSASTKDLGPTSSTGCYSGIDAPLSGYTVYQVGGTNGWTARVAYDSSSLDLILTGAGATGSTSAQRITWATNTNSIFIDSGSTVASIGQPALGGVVGYILQSGDPGYSATVQHGLIVPTADISAGVPWGCFGTNISTGTAIGSGSGNTAAIVAACSTAGIAARLCKDLSLNGYSDWYLPSKDELNKLYLNKSSIGGFNFGGGYWSSSQFDTSNAWIQNFSTGAQSATGGNRTFPSPAATRPVRSF